MHRLYLDPSICPNPPSVGKDPCKNKLLAQTKLDLQSAANDSGSPIICNGGGPLARQFQCEHCNKVYSSKSSPARNPEDHRQGALINTDKGGRRNGGQTEAKQVRTTKAVSSDRLCKFGFRLLWDTHGFYISTLGSGVPFHNYHPCVDPKNLTIPRRLLPEDEEEQLKSMTQACVGSAVGRNYIFSKLGKHIAKSQIVCLNTPKPPTGDIACGLQKSETDELLEFFEKTRDMSHHTLWDVPIPDGQSGLILEVHPFTDEGEPCEIDHRQDPDMEQPRLMAAAVRSNLKFPPEA
jgi:hypothetical protein